MASTAPHHTVAHCPRRLCQGTKFDRIDYNIEQTVNDTADAVKQLQKAEHSQKKSRLMNCILCLLVMCSVMVAILFLKVLV
jgi:syntaxin 16